MKLFMVLFWLPFLLSSHFAGAVDFKQRSKSASAAVTLESLLEDAGETAPEDLPSDEQRPGELSASTMDPALGMASTMDPALEVDSMTFLDPAFGVAESKRSILLPRASSQPPWKKPTGIVDLARSASLGDLLSQAGSHQAAGGEPGDEIEGLQSRVLALASRDPGTEAARDAIRRLVSDNMKPRLVNQMVSAQKKLRQLLVTFDECAPTHHWSELVGYYDKHSRCRRNQSNYTFQLEHATTSWNRSHHSMTTRCHNFSLMDVIPKADECVLPDSPEFVRLHAEQRRDLFRQKFLAWNKSFTACNEAKQDEEMWRERKTLLSEVVGNISSRCRALQTTMDQQACDLNVQDCTQQRKCHHMAMCEYKAEYENAVALEKASQPQYRSLERILCMLSAFEKDDVDAEIGACKDLTHSAEPVSVSWAEFQAPTMPHCGSEIPWPNSTWYVKVVTESFPSNVALDYCSADPCCIGQPIEPCQNR